MNAKRRDHSRGQALVELAVILPVLVVFLVGIFDIGRAVFAYNTIANAARQGARVGAVNQIMTSPDCREDRPVIDPTQPHWSVKQCAAQAAMTLGVTADDVTVAYAAPAGTGLVCTSTHLEVGCLVSVTVTYSYTPITPVIGQLIGTVSMASTSQVQVERVFP